MSLFSSIAETRRLGAPVVRLFRIALGRDPDPAALQGYASRLRGGDALQELAKDIAESEEFCRLHGRVATLDDAFVSRIVSNVLPEGPTREAARKTLQVAADLGLERAQLVAALAD